MRVRLLPRRPPRESEANAPPPEASASTPKERVRQALGDEVSASGYAGDVQIHDVLFEGAEVLVTAQTPEEA